MDIRTNWNRRNFLTATAGVVAAASILPRRLLAKTPFGSNVAALEPGADVYAQLGVKTVINGQGTMTMLGGSLIPPEVEAVMTAAAKHYVHLPSLHVAAGKRIAALLNLPEGYTGYVSSGAAGAIVSGTAAVLTGNNPEFIQQLPDTTGMKSEVIIQSAHRYAFDHQIRCCGVKLIEIETTEDLHRAVNPKTAMLFFFNAANDKGRIKVDEFPKLARQYNLPCFNDAAADTPPVSHLVDYIHMGYDLVAFSGGKAIRGPQCAGLLLGRQEIISNAILNTSPYEDTIARAQKVGKEEIVGMVKALEVFLQRDHAATEQEWWRRLDTITRALKSTPGVSTAYHVPAIANHVPSMEINWDPRAYKLTPGQASTYLENQNPAVVLGQSEMGLSMTSFMLRPGEERIIADALVRMFQTNRA